MTLISLWLQTQLSNILGYSDPSEVSTEADFLDLGFDSLMAVQLKNKVSKELNVDIPVKSLYVYSCIDELLPALSEMILNDDGTRTSLDMMKMGKGVGEIPLSFSQEKAWLLNELMEQALFLGTFPGLSKEMMDYEIDIIHKFVKKYSKIK